MSAEAAVATQRQPTNGFAAAGWCLGALVVAIALSFATNILFYDVLDELIDPFTGGAVVPHWIQVYGSALVVGGAIGGVIGSRVNRGAVGLSVAVALVYVAMWPFAAFFASGMLMATGLALHVLAAAFAARWMRRRATATHQS